MPDADKDRGQAFAAASALRSLATIAACGWSCAVSGQPAPARPGSTSLSTAQALAADISTRSRRAVQVQAIYRVGLHATDRGKSCPISISGSAPRCAPAARLAPPRAAAVQPFRRELRGFIELGCVKQPCLFTMPFGEGAADVPPPLATASRRGRAIVWLTTGRGIKQERSYLFTSDQAGARAEWLDLQAVHAAVQSASACLAVAKML